MKNFENMYNTLGVNPSGIEILPNDDNIENYNKRES